MHTPYNILSIASDLPGGHGGQPPEKQKPCFSYIQPVFPNCRRAFPFTNTVMKRKILVTGGAGFIGSNLVRRLVNDGHDVVVLDSLLRGNKLSPDLQSRIQLVQGDVRDYAVVREAMEGCNMLFHFAAVLGVDVVAQSPVVTMEVEVQGLKNAVDAARDVGMERIVYASTSGVYGHGKIEDGITENVPVAPDTSYAVAKRYNEIYLQSLYQETGFQSISIRFFNIYGANQDNRMVIPRFIEMALAGQDITVFGDGSQTRDFTYVDDAVEASVQLMDKVKGCEIFNIAKEDEIPIRQLAETILKVTGSKSQIKYMEPPIARIDYEVGRRFGSSEKLERFTGYQPGTDLETGIRQIYEQLVVKK